MNAWTAFTGTASVMLAMSLAVAPYPAQAQVVGPQTSSVPATVPDPQISAMLNEVSAARIQQTIQMLVGFETRHTLSSGMPATGGKGAAAAASWIQAEFQRYSVDCGGCLEVKTDEFVQQPGPRVPQATKITNVYAVLRGTSAANAGRIVIVSGHYDSRNSDPLDATGAAPGANDDASGTAVSLECARVLSKHRFPATIIFLTVAGEEQGLNGSSHFAQMAKAERWNIEAVLNNDIVGGDHPMVMFFSGPGGMPPPPVNRDVVRVFSEGVPSTPSDDDLKRMRAIGGENDSSSRELARYVAEIAKEYLGPFGFRAMMVFRRDRFGRGGDHISFNEQGYAAVRFTDFVENYQHQHMSVVKDKSGEEFGDLQQYTNSDYTANVARLNAATLASLASAPAPPLHVRIVMKAPDDPAVQWLRSRTTLKWDAWPDFAIRYELLSRDTTAPEWEHVVSMGNGNEVTTMESKDNVVFAVRAVDAKGHRSLPVVPEPER